MFSSQRFLFKLVFVFLVLAVGISACAGNAASTGSTSVGTVTSITVTDAIETTGNLSAGQLITMTWGTSGLIDKVNVKIGQAVKAGEVLASLRSDSVPADITVAQSDLAVAQRDLQDLLDSSSALSQAQLDVVAARKKVEEAQITYEGLAYPRASDTLIKNVQAKITDAEHNLVLLTRKYKEVQNHPDGDPQKTQALINMTNAQLSLNDLKATLNWYIAKPTDADFEEAKLNLDLARQNLDTARQKRDRVKGGADPLDVAAAEGKVAAAQAKVNAMLVIAPFSGEVIFVQAVAGNSVNKSDSAIGVVNRATIKIDTLIDENSIASVSVGDTAEISMDSLSGEPLKGVVTLINPIGQTVNGLVKYTVTVSVAPTDQPLLFGATASVKLITSEPRAMLAVPIGAVQTDTKGEYVLRMNADGSSARVEIKSGDLSGNLVTITTGGDLKKGDQVQVGASTGTNSSGGSNNNNPGGPGGGPFGIGG